MMVQTRFIPAAGGATAATFGIFLMMQGLATVDLPDFKEPTARPLPVVFFNPPPPPAAREMEHVTPPEIVDPPVLDDLPPPTIDPDTKIPPISPPKAPPSPQDGPDTNLGFADGHMIPIARVTPTYPRIAAARGIEGWVQLSFTVNRYGTVEDAVVIAAEPAGVFNRPALDAIRKFRYKPTVVDGTAQDTPNVQIKLTFSLQE